ncbi:MAG: hypothetical protein IT209_05200 [Armatimonadetes bacterium]|nr:hypothetical protein [Armatimonadota bacterium]
MSAISAVLTVIIAGMFILLWLVLMAWAMRTTLRWWIFQKTPHDTVPAVVSRVAITPEPSLIGEPEPLPEFLLEFLTDSGETMSLSATPAQYESVQQGDRVTLFVKAGRVVDFRVEPGASASRDVRTRIIRDE